jgi:endonuclease/exonuclease/phosphatase (EEP) superfamily protein YafD
LLFLAADRWWVGTVAMYSPRWLWSMPLALLLPLAALLRRRSHMTPLALALIVLLGPVMHLCVPWRRALRAGRNAAAHPIRVVTLNADLADLHPEELRQWIDQTRPDVLALQAVADGHRHRIFGHQPLDHGWHVRKDGELLLASRYPISAARVYDGGVFSAGHGGVLAAYDLQTPDGVVHLFNIHIATPRYALLAVVDRGWSGSGDVEANIERRRAQSELARQWVDAAMASGGRVLVLGDLNMPPDSAIYRRYWLDFSNAFTSSGFGFGSTHFTRHTAVRIDHVLAGPAWRFRRAWVGPFVGSAHRPVVADVQLTGAAG